MTSLHTSRRGRRKSTFGRASEVLAFALDLAGKGERVRLCLSWMDSFHDPSFSVVCLHGPAVRHPMTVRRDGRPCLPQREKNRVAWAPCQRSEDTHSLAEVYWTRRAGIC
jgi:hypothetical protein